MSPAPAREGRRSRPAVPARPVPRDVFAALTDTYVDLLETVLGSGQPSSATPSHGRDPHYAWGRTPISIAPMNRIMAPRLAGSAGEVEELVETIGDRFAGLPFSWWLDPGTAPADLEATIFRVAPRAHRELVPAMALALPGPGSAAIGPAAQGGVPIEVVMVRDPADIVEAETLAAEGFGAALDEAAPFGSLFGDLSPDAAARLIVALARLDDRPAATGLGCLAGDVLGIYNVATLPSARRRGLATAVMEAILAAGASRGCRLAVLESTEEGQPLYRALGFREAGLFTVLEIPPDRPG